jgi:hypothetical protein
MTTAFSAQASAQDVYNFYFNKGGQPPVVIQGGGGASVPMVPVVPAPVIEQPVATPIAPMVQVAQPAPRIRNWGLGFGVATVGSLDRSSYVILGQYHFNRYFALEGALALGSEERGSRSSANERSTARAQGDSRSVPALAVALTPFHLSVFGFETLRVGFQLGLMPGQTDRPSAPERGSARGVAAASQLNRDNSAELTTFTGLTVAFQFNEALSAEMTARAGFDGDKVPTMTSLALVGRF